VIREPHVHALLVELVAAARDTPESVPDLELAQADAACVLFLTNVKVFLGVDVLRQGVYCLRLKAL
tara:strand:+ start:183 stop:380 length:198 start_codon:yes stop_codon:yes gene_type:complete